MQPRQSLRPGLTLVELIIVLVILVGLASIVVPLISPAIQDANSVVTDATLLALRDTILGQYRLDMDGKLPQPADTDALRNKHPQLRYVFVKPEDAIDYNPLAKRGWRGPYISAPIGHYLTGPRSGQMEQTYNPDYLATTPYVSAFATITPPPSLKDFGETGDPTVFDAWGYPVVIWKNTTVIPNRWELRSAGPDSILGNLDDRVMVLYTTP